MKIKRDEEWVAMYEHIEKEAINAIKKAKRKGKMEVVLVKEVRNYKQVDVLIEIIRDINLNSVFRADCKRSVKGKKQYAHILIRNK